MNSAYQIFEDFYGQDCIFVEVKEMWRQAVRCKASNLVTPSLGGRYIIFFKTRYPSKFPPGDGALFFIMVFTKYPSGGCF